MKIGFIGMGIMGKPMCLNLLKNNIELGVFNRTKEKTDEIISAGAKYFDSETKLGDWADAIIIMVSDDIAVKAIINKVDNKKIIVNMSTISLSLARELTQLSKDKKFDFVNAPVSGTKKPAEDGTLVIFAGGKKETVEKLKDVFDAMGKITIYSITPQESAKKKLVVNYLLGAMMSGLSESIIMCEKLGLNKEEFLKTISSGPLGCGFFKVKSDNLLNENFSPSFPAKHMFKDLKYLEQELNGKDYRIKSNLIELFKKTSEKFPDEDLSAIYKIFLS